MRVRFLADADFNHRIVLGLRRRSPAIDCVGAIDGGVIGLADPDVLRAAATAHRILLSHDLRTIPRHFARFLELADSPGLILAPQALEIGRTIDDLLLIWTASDTDDWKNQIGYLPL